MRTIAIMSQKGGTGKTTTTVNLAAALGERNRRVLLIDMDPQASATLWFGLEGETHGKELIAAHSGKRSLLDFLYQTNMAGVQMIPSSFALFDLTRQLARANEPNDHLRRQIEQFPEGHWDYVLLDCPPEVSTLSRNALHAAGELIVPVAAQYLALHGVNNVLRLVNEVREQGNPDLLIAGIVACRVDSRVRHPTEVVQLLRDQFGDTVFDTVIRENVRLAESPSFRLSILDYDSNSHGAEDYRALAQEVLRQERKRNRQP